MNKTILIIPRSKSLADLRADYIDALIAAAQRANMAGNPDVELLERIGRLLQSMGSPS